MLTTGLTSFCRAALRRAGLSEDIGIKLLLSQVVIGVIKVVAVAEGANEAEMEMGLSGMSRMTPVILTGVLSLPISSVRPTTSVLLK
jgi:hypothetical protein